MPRLSPSRRIRALLEYLDNLVLPANQKEASPRTVDDSDDTENSVTTHKDSTLTVTTSRASTAQWKPPLHPLSHSVVPQLSLISMWTTSKEPGSTNEDAALWSTEISAAAIFDGATESFAAARWVNILASQWEANTQIDLPQAQKSYEEQIGQLPLTWAQSEAILRGSFTTYATIQPTEGGLLATLVGDSAIIVYDRGEITGSFPFTSAEEFTSVPDAIPSSPALMEMGDDLLSQGTWTIGVSPESTSYIVLATDALAAWLLVSGAHARRQRFLEVLRCRSYETWETLVKRERRMGRMKVDDTTVMVLEARA